MNKILSKLITGLTALGAIAIAFFTVSKQSEKKGELKAEKKQAKQNNQARKEADKRHEENANIDVDDLKRKLRNDS